MDNLDIDELLKEVNNSKDVKDNSKSKVLF